MALLLAAACDGEDAVTVDAICAATPDDVEITVSSADLIEASGVAASRIDDDFFWTHNDSGDTARIFAIDRDGWHHATYSLPGAGAIDWEDMAAGPGLEEGASYLYLGDIGDNSAQRSEIVVYRVQEPEVVRSDTPTANDFVNVERFVLRYPDHPHDAETLLVDPVEGDLLIVTKEVTGGPSLVFRAPGSLESGVTTTLEQVGEINFRGLTSNVEIPAGAPPIVRAAPHLPTGGDVSPDGGLVAVRTYGTVWVWERPEDAPLWRAFDAAPCEAPSIIEPQGEAIAFDADGSGYFTVSEGEDPPLYHFIAR